MDSFSLFAANVVILCVTALAFLAAWSGRRHESYWQSWALANVVLAAALVIFMYEARLPDTITVIAPNALLVAGLGLRWQAAREFSGRTVSALTVWGPAALFVSLCAVPFIFQSYAAVYTIVNVILALQAAAVAREFWRDRADGLPSRYGLVAAYAIIAASFAARGGQGMFLDSGIAPGLPHDLLLEIHLTVAIVHTVASGAFALSLAYERSTMDLRRAALRDPLTGLFNRRAFDAQMHALLSGPKGRPFAVAVLDIDHFKAINDRFGHVAGDEALRHCAAVCQAALRKGDLLARMGGEEFAVILPDTGTEEAFAIVDRLRGAVAAHEMHCEGDIFRLTLSAGLYHGRSGTDDFDGVMRQADAELYRAKHAGRDRVAPDPRADAGLFADLEDRADLARAVEKPQENPQAGAEIDHVQPQRQDHGTG